MKNVLELKTKKMSLANIDGRLTPAEMENIMAGSGSCGSATGFMCMASVLLLFTPVAPVSAAYAIGCGIGIYAGCAR